MILCINGFICALSLVIICSISLLHLGASGRLYFVIEAFLGYLQLYFCNAKHFFFLQRMKLLYFVVLSNSW